MAATLNFYSVWYRDHLVQYIGKIGERVTGPNAHKEMSKFLLPTKVQFTCLALQESRAMYVPNPET